MLSLICSISRSHKVLKKKKKISEYLYNIIIEDQYSKAHYSVKVFVVFTIYKSCLVEKNLIVEFKIIFFFYCKDGLSKHSY